MNGVAWLALAWLVAAAHLGVIVAVIAGGPLALRWPALVRPHLGVVAGVGAVFAAGADCPLTTWEKAALRRAGRAVYEGGFIEHRLLGPFIADGMTTALSLTVAAAWVLPTVVSYALLLQRRRRTPRPLPI